MKSESEEDKGNQSGVHRVGWMRWGEGRVEVSGRVGEGGRKRVEGRRRHVCRSMIYRLHCHHGDFCQPHSSIQSGGGGEEGELEWGERRWKEETLTKISAVSTNQPACHVQTMAPAVTAEHH